MQRLGDLDTSALRCCCGLRFRNGHSEHTISHAGCDLAADDSSREPDGTMQPVRVSALLAKVAVSPAA